MLSVEKRPSSANMVNRHNSTMRLMGLITPMLCSRDDDAVLEDVTGEAMELGYDKIQMAG